MRICAALLLALAMADFGRAATAYVSDELVLGVYSSQSTQGPRLATLHSGASVEALAVNGDSTQVRLADGTTGWVKSAYLTTTAPATVRIKLVQEELDRLRATAPGLAEAAEHREVDRLTTELAKRSAVANAVASAVGTGPVDGDAKASAAHPWAWAAAVFIALCGGFWLGYATLARRIKNRFGGIKVY